MKRSRLLLMMLAIAFAFAVSQGLALTQAQAPDSGAPVVENVDNNFCPVSGDKVSVDQISGKAKYFVDHEGKRYGLCCQMCEKDFKKDPEKYIEKMNVQEESGEEPVSGMMGMEGEHEH